MKNKNVPILGYTFDQYERQERSRPKVSKKMHYARESDVQFIRLNPSEAQKIFKIASKIKSNPYSNFEQFLFDSTIAYQGIPARIRRKVLKYSSYLNNTGVLLLKGLPVDPQIPSTPSTANDKIEKNTFISEMLLCGISSALGEIYGYEAEKSGSLIHQIHPTKVGELSQSNESSKVLLRFHSELAFHPTIRPDYILLTCLRQDEEKEARTYFANLDDIYEHLTQDERTDLFGGDFEIDMLYSFSKMSDGAPPKFPIPVLYGDYLRPNIRYNSQVHTKDPDSQKALEQVQNIANSVKKFVHLEAGDLVIIDNRRTLHARSEFKAYYRGRDRWLQRVYVTKDLTKAGKDIRNGDRIVRTNLSTRGEE